MSTLRHLLTATIIATGLLSPLSAEIEEMTVRWRAGSTCLSSCILGLQKQFQKLPAAVGVQMNGPGASATMRWKPRMHFSFSDLNTAIRAIGVSFSDLHITLRGTISHKGKKVIISSIGDDTNFFLLSPITVEPNRMATPNNPDAYVLQPATYEKLLRAEDEYRVVKVSGMMLMPWRAPPNYLIIESLEIPTNGGGSNTATNEHRPLFSDQNQMSPSTQQTQPMSTVPETTPRRSLFSEINQGTSPPQSTIPSNSNNNNTSSRPLFSGQGVSIPGATSNRPLFIEHAPGTTIPGATSNRPLFSQPSETTAPAANYPQ